jgi:hypothetical protein
MSTDDILDFEAGIKLQLRQNERRLKIQLILIPLIAIGFLANIFSFLVNFARPVYDGWAIFGMILNGAAALGCVYSFFLGLRILGRQYLTKLELPLPDALDKMLPGNLHRYRGLSSAHSYFHPYGWNGVTKHFVIVDDDVNYSICTVQTSLYKKEIDLQFRSIEEHLAYLFSKKGSPDFDSIKQIAECLSLSEVNEIIQARHAWSDQFGLLAIIKHPTLVDHYCSDEAFEQWAKSLLDEDSVIFNKGFTRDAQLSAALKGQADLILVRGFRPRETPSAVIQQMVSLQAQNPTEDRAVILFRWIKALLDGDAVQFGSDDPHDDWFEVCPRYLLSKYCRLEGLSNLIVGPNPAYPSVLKDLFDVLLAPSEVHDPQRAHRFSDDMIRGYHRLYGFERAMQLFPSKTRLFLENDLDL